MDFTRLARNLPLKKDYTHNPQYDEKTLAVMNALISVLIQCFVIGSLTFISCH